MVAPYKCVDSPCPLCSLGVAIADEKDDLSARLAALS